MRDVGRLVDNAQEVSQQLNDGKRFKMDCPRCNSQAVYVSRSGNARIFFPASLLVQLNGWSSPASMPRYRVA